MQTEPLKNPPKALPSNGFGDSFVPSSGSGQQKDFPHSPVKGFSDSFDGSGFTTDRKPAREAEKPTASAVSGLGSGFGDSFVPSTKSLEPGSRPTSAAPPIASSPPVIGEMSFDVRFPSVEALMAASGSNYASSPTSAGDLLSPLSVGAPFTSESVLRRQPYEREYSKPHISLTGGNENTHQLADIGQDNQPLPKSTHVTGTAFRRVEDYQRPYIRPNLTSRDSRSSVTTAALNKAVEDAAPQHSPSRRPANLSDDEKRRPQSLQLPGPAVDRLKEFEQGSSSIASTKKPVIADLLTGEELPSSDLDMRSLIQPMSATTGDPKTRLQVPPPVSAKPKSLSVSTATPAAESALPGSEARPGIPRRSATLLSDNWSPLESARAALSENKPTTDGQVKQAEQPKMGVPGGKGPTSTVIQKAAPRTTSTSPSLSSQNSRTPPKIIQRMSHYESGSEEPSKSLNPPQSARVQDERGRTELLPTKSSPRKVPQPVARRSSINAIVSRFEAMSSPPQGDGMAGYPGSRAAMSPETSPVRAAPHVKPAVAPKPLQHRQPSLSKRRESIEPEPHAAASAAVTAAAPQVASEATAIPPALASQDAHGRPQQDAPSGLSPEEPKSVHSLIARWNKGGPPVTGVAPQALKAKPALGQGRKL